MRQVNGLLKLSPKCRFDDQNLDLVSVALFIAQNNFYIYYILLYIY